MNQWVKQDELLFQIKIYLKCPWNYSLKTWGDLRNLHGGNNPEYFNSTGWDFKDDTPIEEVLAKLEEQL